MRKTLLAGLLLLLIGSVSATTISSENVTVDLSDSTVHVETHVSELTSEDFNYLISYPVTGVESRIDGEPASCETTSSTLESEISCEVNQSADFTVELNFTGTTLTRERGRERMFRYSQSFFRPTESFRLTAVLPKGFVLAEGRNVSQPFSPSSGTITSDGQRISVTWSLNPGLGGEDQLYRAVYEEASPTPGLRILVAAAAGVLIAVIVGYISYTWLFRESVESLYGELEDDQVELIELLRENDGEMLQKDAVKQLNYSKAKVSGLVSELVEEGVLEKKKEGRSNKLSVSRNYKV